MKPKFLRLRGPSIDGDVVFSLVALDAIMVVEPVAQSEPFHSMGARTKLTLRVGETKADRLFYVFEPLDEIASLFKSLGVLK